MSLGKFGVEVFIFTPFERSFDLSANVHVVSMGSVFGFSRGFYRLSRVFYYNRMFPTLFSKGGLRSGKVFGGFLRKVAKFLCESGVDVVQVEQDVALPVGVFLKEVTGLPLVVDLHNISSEELVAAGVLERDSAGFLDLQCRTGEFLGEADWVVVVSELMRDYVVGNYGLSKACVGVVPPGGRVLVDETVVERRVKPFKVVYAGLVAYRERV
ncbi:MAG: glycosyltransferase, partial [Candidatus Freyarchaeota archaeon]|nr:glycosyltransferase [Candidatus Jordarchaeia archaeon]